MIFNVVMADLATGRDLSVVNEAETSALAPDHMVEMIAIVVVEIEGSNRMYRSYLVGTTPKGTNGLVVEVVTGKNLISTAIAVTSIASIANTASLPKSISLIRIGK